MDNNWAAEHLQTIRTLMERAALYRRALAPVMICVGAIGIIAAIIAEVLKFNESGKFAVFWMAVAIVAVASAFLLTRRQALRQHEAFWSPPTRRVAQAMLPPLLIGAVVGCCAAAHPLMVVTAWIFLYGLALHSAGFFMARGIRLFAWALIVFGILLGIRQPAGLLNRIPPNCLMGLIFGAAHIAYGIYLYFTERKNAA